jgi:hypothetical protein
MKPVPEEALTLEQLDLCVRGELFVINKHLHGPEEPYPSRKFYLRHAEWRQEYEDAKNRGWCRLDLEPWEKFCKLTGRPHAYLDASRGHRCVYLHVATPEGFDLDRAAADRLYGLLNAHVRKGHSVRVSNHGVYAQFPQKEWRLAAELIGPVLDIVLESLCPKDRDRLYWRTKAGVDEYDGRVGPDYADGDALAAALARVRPEDVPVMAEGYVDQKERARLARELFKRLGLKKVGVTMATGSMCGWVYVRPPRCRDHGPRERLAEVLHAAFPGCGERDWSVQ